MPRDFSTTQLKRPSQLLLCWGERAADHRGNATRPLLSVVFLHGTVDTVTHIQGHKESYRCCTNSNRPSLNKQGWHTHHFLNTVYRLERAHLSFAARTLCLWHHPHLPAALFPTDTYYSRWSRSENHMHLLWKASSTCTSTTIAVSSEAGFSCNLGRQAKQRSSNNLRKPWTQRG